MFHLQGQLVIIHHRVSREDLEHQSCYFKPLPCSEHRSCNGIYSVLTSCSISAVKSNCRVHFPSCTTITILQLLHEYAQEKQLLEILLLQPLQHSDTDKRVSY